MRRHVSIIASVAVAVVICFSTTANAEIGSALGDLEWGDDVETVLEKLRAEKLAELREDSRLRNDRPAMQQARQRVLDQMRQVEDSYTELKGEETDYDVSVIATEFTANNGEAILRVRDDVAQRFYFFIGGHFYKLVVAYYQDQVKNIGFSAFVDRVRQQYGEPVSREYGTVRGEEGVVEAMWKDGDHHLRVNDRRAFFGTYTMTFGDRQSIEQWEQQGRTFGGNDDEEEAHQVSDRVRSLSEPSGGERRSAVEDMVGEVEVDLGRDEEEEEEEAASTAAAEPTPSADEDPDPEPEPDPTPRPQRAEPEEEDDDDDLVIY